MTTNAVPTAPALFALPRVSLRCWPVVQRNWLVWKKLALPSLLGNIAEPLIILVAFGYGLGSLVSLTFAAIALVFNALARGYDFFTYYFTLVLTPMTFLSGVYFLLEQMPPWLQHVAAVLPLSAAVELIRPLVIGHWPSHWLQPLVVLLAYAAMGYWIALALTRRRFLR
jgi:ABC-type multidrug transport system permease subunit